MQLDLFALVGLVGRTVVIVSPLAHVAGMNLARLFIQIQPPRHPLLLSLLLFRIRLFQFTEETLSLMPCTRSNHLWNLRRLELAKLAPSSTFACNDVIVVRDMGAEFVALFVLDAHCDIRVVS